MSMERVFNVAAAIVGVAMAATLVASPNTARIVSAVGGAFSGSLRAAMGR